MKLKQCIATTTSIAITALSLAACTQPVKGTTYSTIMQDHRVTRSINYDLVSEMREGDVQIIQQGSRLQLILPINKFFKLASPELKLYRQPTLELVSLYLHNFIHTHHTHFPIKVYAYTDEVPMHADRYEYSRQYAQVIAAYLWSHGFTPQQMRVVGFGAENPIASNSTSTGSMYNERVVIQVN
jgi:outer membrane protein OmpA-like peptidoglycan-associated protein